MSRLTNLPAITFATADPDEMETNAVAIMEGLLDRKIERADPVRLFLKAFISVIIQQRILIDYCAKQNLLAYATGDFLDHIGVLVGATRLPASAATTTVEITLSAERNKTTVIQQGTRVTADDVINFSLDEAVIFLAGETVKTCSATCLTVGEVGNGFAIGEINHIVDPQPYLASIVNTTVSEGGADTEDDEAFRDRIQEAPESFSVAGPEGAYIFWTKSVSPLITSVSVESENPGEVTIRALLKGGEIPGDEMIADIQEMFDGQHRPLTDHVLVKQPTIVQYDISLRYYVARSDAVNAVNIQAAADAAISDYVEWQAEALGRDINISELHHRIRDAGAKRVEISSPTFTVIDKNSVAKAQNIEAVFAGIEDD